MGDFGKLLGDDMVDTDLVELDGLGMGGEMSGAGRDTRGSAMSEVEAEMNVERAKMDGVTPQRRFETQRQVGPVLDTDFGIDPDDGLYE